MRSFQSQSGSDPDMQILVVGHTMLYRHLAMTLVSSDDRAVDIGCSYGHCTALFCCPALGVDVGAGCVQEAQRLYPACRFCCGDVLGDDLSWLDRDATVLWLDIGGGEDYKRVMKAIATCIPLMTKLRLVVTKSKEVRSFLLRFPDSVNQVARDLVAPEAEDEDTEAAEEMAIEIRRRGGEVPLSLIEKLCCFPRLRYRLGRGKHRLLEFLQGQAPLLVIVEVSSGPSDCRVRVQATAGKVPPALSSALLPVRHELAEKVRHLLRNAAEVPLQQVFLNLKRKVISRFVAVASDPELYQQSSDHSLDDRCLETWSDAWRVSVAMRHLHAFLLSTPEFAVSGNTAGKVATYKELCSFCITSTGEPEVLEVDAQIVDNVMEGQRIILQVLEGNWRKGEEDVLDLQDLIVEDAWLLVAGQVVKQLTPFASSD